MNCQILADARLPVRMGTMPEVDVRGMVVAPKDATRIIAQIKGVVPKVGGVPHVQTGATVTGNRIINMGDMYREI